MEDFGRLLKNRCSRARRARRCFGVLSECFRRVPLALPVPSFARDLTSEALAEPVAITLNMSGLEEPGYRFIRQDDRDGQSCRVSIRYELARF